MEQGGCSSSLHPSNDPAPAESLGISRLLCLQGQFNTQQPAADLGSPVRAELPDDVDDFCGGGLVFHLCRLLLAKVLLVDVDGVVLPDAVLHQLRDSTGEAVSGDRQRWARGRGRGTRRASRCPGT